MEETSAAKMSEHQQVDVRADRDSSQTSHIHEPYATTEREVLSSRDLTSQPSLRAVEAAWTKRIHDSQLSQSTAKEGQHTSLTYAAATNKPTEDDWEEDQLSDSDSMWQEENEDLAEGEKETQQNPSANNLDTEEGRHVSCEDLLLLAHLPKTPGQAYVGMP